MVDIDTVRAILEGMPLSGRTRVKCARCGAHLEGAGVELVARNVDEAGWHVVTVYDMGCGPETVLETPFGPSVLATARIGMLADVLDQSHRPALLDVEIVDANPADPAPGSEDAQGQGGDSDVSGEGRGDQPQPDGGEVLVRDDDRETLDGFGMVR